MKVDILANVLAISPFLIVMVVSRNGTEQVSKYRESFVSNGLSTRACVWEKTNPSPMNGQHLWLSSLELCVYGKNKNATFNEHCASPVWRLPTEPKEFHPTAKPIRLMEIQINASTNENDMNTSIKLIKLSFSKPKSTSACMSSIDLGKSFKSII